MFLSTRRGAEMTDCQAIQTDVVDYTFCTAVCGIKNQVETQCLWRPDCVSINM